MHASCGWLRLAALGADPCSVRRVERGVALGEVNCGSVGVRVEVPHRGRVDLRPTPVRSTAQRQPRRSIKPSVSRSPRCRGSSVCPALHASPRPLFLPRQERVVCATTCRTSSRSWPTPVARLAQVRTPPSRPGFAATPPGALGRDRLRRSNLHHDVFAPTPLSRRATARPTAALSKITSRRVLGPLLLTAASFPPVPELVMASSPCSASGTLTSDRSCRPSARIAFRFLRAVVADRASLSSSSPRGPVRAGVHRGASIRVGHSSE